MVGDTYRITTPNGTSFEGLVMGCGGYLREEVDGLERLRKTASGEWPGAVNGRVDGIAFVTECVPFEIGLRGLRESREATTWRVQLVGARVELVETSLERARKLPIARTVMEARTTWRPPGVPSVQRLCGFDESRRGDPHLQAGATAPLG